jgi:SAM-dependent methyltransferase
VLFRSPYQALENINRLLKTNGVLYISFHYLYPVHNPEGLDFLRYTPDGAEKLLKEAGFEILDHRRRVLEDDFSKTALSALISCEKMRPRKNYDHTIIGSLIKARKK